MTIPSKETLRLDDDEDDDPLFPEEPALSEGARSSPQLSQGFSPTLKNIAPEELGDGDGEEEERDVEAGSAALARPEILLGEPAHFATQDSGYCSPLSTDNTLGLEGSGDGAVEDAAGGTQLLLMWKTRCSFNAHAAPLAIPSVFHEAFK